MEDKPLGELYGIVDGEHAVTLTPDEARRLIENLTQWLETKPGMEARAEVVSTPKHPLQPLWTDECGTLRFKPNAIVKFLLDAGPCDLNQIACMPFEDADREQLAQLIGYSLSGFCELSYVSDETYNLACSMA